MRFISAGIALGLVAVPSIDSALAADPPAIATKTIQQLFDEADAANAAGEFGRAVDLLTQLEGRVARNPRAGALVQVRKWRALVELGRPDAALPLLERAKEMLLAVRLEGATFKATAKRYKVSVSTVEKQVASALAFLAAEA